MSYEVNKRWRLTHRKGRNQQRRKNYQKTAKARNSRLAWKTKDVNIIMASDKPCDTVLAQELGRSVQAIQGKRAKIKAQR